MPYKCSVPCCRGNYDDETKSTRFWISFQRKIKNRKDFTYTKNSKVCEKHFKEDDIVHNSTYFDENTGKLISVKLQQP